MEDAYVTMSTIAKKTEVPITSSSHSSDMAAKFLNFVDIPTTKAEIVSPMDVPVHHEVPSGQTPTLLTVLVSVITESSPVYTTNIPQSLQSFTPPPLLSTPTPPPTTKAKNPQYALPDFASVFQFNNRVSALEKDVSELKKDDPLKTQVTALSRFNFSDENKAEGDEGEEMYYITMSDLRSDCGIRLNEPKLSFLQWDGHVHHEITKHKSPTTPYIPYCTCLGLSSESSLVSHLLNSIKSSNARTAVQFDVVGFFFCFFYFSDSTSTSISTSTSTSSSMKLHHSFRIFLQYRCWFGEADSETLTKKVNEESCVKTCRYILKKILIDKMDKSESYLAAPEHKECYEGLRKSHDLDKTIFSTYEKVYSLKRSRKDKDKDEDPSAGSDRGLKKKKTSKDAEPTKGPKGKES
ncbi:hypothetical protein Tco_0369023 [Tanacetum coccineum]